MIFFRLCRSVTLGFFFEPDRPFVARYVSLDQKPSFDKISDCDDVSLKSLDVNTLLNNTFDCANSIGKPSRLLSTDHNKTLLPGVHDFPLVGQFPSLNYKTKEPDHQTPVTKTRP